MDLNESTSSNSSDDYSDNESAFEEDDTTGSDYAPSDNDEHVSSTSEEEDSVSQASTSKSFNQKKKTSFSILNKQPETIDDLFPGPESNQQVDAQETIDDIFPDNSDANEQCAAKKKELYPPEGKRVKNPSIVWKFGGFRRKENGSLDMEFVFCGLCPKKYKYNNSPSHFKGHLLLEHKRIYEKELGSNDAGKS